MSKRIRYFYIFLFITMMIMIGVCLSIGKGQGVTSFPWWTGLVFPTILLTIPLFFYAIFIAWQEKRYQELVMISFILLIQIGLCF